MTVGRPTLTPDTTLVSSASHRYVPLTEESSVPTKLANEQRAHIESVQTDTCARARRSELDERCREGTVEALVRPHQFSLPRQRMRANRKWATRQSFDRRSAAMGEMSSRSPKLAGGAATATPGHGVGRGTPRAVLGGQGSRFGNSTYIVAGRRGRTARPQGPGANSRPPT